MDRLLCGDVGYGKTELALRAAFKICEYGKQVAVLVPTTVLAEQHFQTFTERLADYPFSVDVLSRFRAKKDQAHIVERARKGQIDILIGTHRLLSHDVRFRRSRPDHHRRGAALRRRGERAPQAPPRDRRDPDAYRDADPADAAHVDARHPRHFSLATAPVDRRSIVTQVRMWDDRLIRESVLRELNRDGQVYFVHNFVRDIHQVA